MTSPSEPGSTGICFSPPVIGRIVVGIRTVAAMLRTLPGIPICPVGIRCKKEHSLSGNTAEVGVTRRQADG
jgi:hypothetical protein